MVFGLDNLIESKLRSIIAGQGATSTVDVKNGNIHIEDVHFDESLIEDAFAKQTGQLLPVTIEMIHVRKLSLILPWTGGELGVALDGVHVLLRKRPQSEVTAEQLLKVKDMHVNMLLADLIARIKAVRKGATKKDSGDGGSGGDNDDNDEVSSFAERTLQKMIQGLVKKILNNLEVEYRPTECPGWQHCRACECMGPRGGVWPCVAPATLTRRHCRAFSVRHSRVWSSPICT
jgi:hypothetical protein